MRVGMHTYKHTSQKLQHTALFICVRFRLPGQAVWLSSGGVDGLTAASPVPRTPVSDLTSLGLGPGITNSADTFWMPMIVSKAGNRTILCVARARLQILRGLELPFETYIHTYNFFFYRWVSDPQLTLREWYIIYGI